MSAILVAWAAAGLAAASNYAPVPSEISANDDPTGTALDAAKNVLKNPVTQGVVLTYSAQLLTTSGFALAADMADWIPVVGEVVAVAQGLKALHDGYDAYSNKFDQCMSTP